MLGSVFDIWVLSFSDDFATMDLTGTKISSLDQFDEAFHAGGINTIRLPEAEIYVALLTGVVDAAAISSRAGFDSILADDSNLNLYHFSATDDRILSRTVVTDGAILGGGEADVLEGTNGDDIIVGLGGNDTIEGGMGNDAINGGQGTDLASFTGNQASYTLALNPNGVEITDRRDGGNGTDELIGVELLDFDTDLLGGPFDLTKFAGPTSLSADQLESVIELYIAYFDRAPDAVGLFFWATAYAAGTTLDEMANLFIDQPETIAAYPSGTPNQAFAETVYSNVLGRIPDAAGLNFWVDVLDGGSVPRSSFILEVLRGAKADSSPDASSEFVAQQLADRAYLDSKIDVGAYFAVHKGMSSAANATSAMDLYDGSILSLTVAISAIDNFELNALDPTNGEFLMPLVGVLDNPFSAITADI